MFGDEDFIESDEPSAGKVYSRNLVRRILPYFRPYRARIAVAAALLLVSTGISLFGPLLLKHAIDVDIPSGKVLWLVRTSVAYLVLQVAVFLIGYYQRIELAKVAERAAADLKQNLYRWVLNLPMSFFDRNPVGRLLTRVDSDTEALKNLFQTTAVVIVQDLVLLVGMSVVMIVINFKLYLIIVALIPPFVLALGWFQRKIRPVYIGIRKTVADINNFTNESVRGLPVVQAFRQESWLARRMDEFNRSKYRQEMHGMSLWYRIWFLVDFGEILGMVFVIALGGTWALRGLITIGTLFLFVSYITRLFQPLRGLSDQINVMQRAFASAERIFGILDQLPEEHAAAVRPLPAFTDAICFENVNFAYDGREWVLKDLNLKVGRGEKVALVGETGGGKTSVISLLLKFYVPQQGMIRIDDTSLATACKASVRGRIGLVPQDVILFPGSILDNLRLFDETIAETRVRDAAARARIARTIESFPERYETNIIERGINLSLGERQLLSFARALVFDPEILILDEATSSVDPHTERLIQEGLTELLRGRTAIIIAHRLTTIQMADRIIVVHRGTVREQGTHDELIARDGYYARLYRLQYLSEAAA